MIIGITGPQGAGKTTLLNELNGRGWVVDEFKASRSVQAALGWDSLKRVEDNPQDMVAYQHEVYKHKLANELKLIEVGYKNLNKFVLADRTFSDIASYAALWSRKFLLADKWSVDEMADFLIPFWDECIKSQREIYDKVIMLPFMEHMTFEVDPHRASQEDISPFFIWLTKFNNGAGVDVFTISQKSVSDRADEVENNLFTKVDER